MKVTLFISACFIALIAAFGFILGQLFFATFSLPKSIAGVAGLLSAGTTFAMSTGSQWAPKWAVWASVLALLGLALDVGQFYLYPHSAGNYYPWDLVAPLSACLVFVAYVAFKRRSIGKREA